MSSSATDGVEFRKEKLGVRELWRESRGLIGTQYWTFVGICLVGIFIGSAAPMSVLLGPMMCGIYMCFFSRMQGREVNFSQVFKGFDHFLESFIATLIMTAFSLVIMVPVALAMMTAMLAVGVGIGVLAVEEARTEEVVEWNDEFPADDAGAIAEVGEESAELDVTKESTVAGPRVDAIGEEHAEEEAWAQRLIEQDHHGHGDHEHEGIAESTMPPTVTVLVVAATVAVYGGLILAIFLMSVLLGVFVIFTFPLIVDRGLKGWPAVVTSFRAVKANYWSLVKLMFVNTLLVTIAAMFCYVPAFLILPCYIGSVALAYRRIFPETEAIAQEPLPV